MIYNRLIVAAIGFIRLEPYDGKLSRTVLRGGKDSNALLLPDYASVEMLYHPEYVGKPLAVGGDSEARHGIVLTANYIAKRSGVKTGMALWQAKQVCPDLIFVPPRMDLYLKFSSMLREIYSEYTNQVEPYGCDEAWLDVTDSFSQAAVPENLDLFLPVLRLCEYHISVKFYSLIFLHIEDLIPEVSRLVHDNSSD